LSALINLPIVEKPVERALRSRRDAIKLLKQVSGEASRGNVQGDQDRQGGQRHHRALTEFDEADLMDGDVTVRVEWSTLNYKDGLAVTGKAPVVRRFPMIAGIDFAGTVEQSSHPDWKAGDR